MNRFKRNILGVIFICTVMIFIAGCNNQIRDSKTADAPPKSNLTKVLTCGEIEHSLYAKGVQLATTTEDNGTYKINDITPAMYNLNDTESILVYDFSSIAERVRNVPGSYLADALAYDYPLSDTYSYWTFTVRNFLIVYRVDTKAMNDLTFENDLKIIKQVALDLNDGEEVLLHGKNKNWEAQTFIQYYQNWYEDENGGIRADQMSQQVVKLKYCGVINEKPQSMRYEYKYPSGTGKGTLHSGSEDKDGWVSLGRIDSSFIPDSQTVCTLNLMWDNNNESINMTQK